MYHSSINHLESHSNYYGALMGYHLIQQAEVLLPHSYTKQLVQAQTKTMLNSLHDTVYYIYIYIYIHCIS